MSSAMAKIYTAVNKVLTDALAPATVPAVNIRPTQDESEPDVGNMVYYNWVSGSWDVKRRRGTGLLSLSVGSVEEGVDANEILDLARDALTARALSYSGSPLIVHLFKETDSLADAETTDSGRSLAATSFDVKMVEA